MPTNTTDPNLDFFIRKTLEGYDSRIKVIEEKFEKFESALSNIFAGLQAVQATSECIGDILINKNIITREELEKGFEDLYSRFKAMMDARGDA